MKNKIIIGLTGNIATGKSTVMEMLAEQGALTIDADQLVHEIMAENPTVQEQIVARFGRDIQLAGGAIDRSALGSIVFANPAAMGDLEAIIHPHVGGKVDELRANSEAPVMVIEAIKLLESALRERCHSIWVTNCRPEQQIERLTLVRRLSRHEALIRVLSQAPQEIKLAQADVIIDTSGKFSETEKQVTRAWQELSIAEETAREIEEETVDLEVEIRRAGPRDVDAMAAFIKEVKPEREEIDRMHLLQSFGEHGYMLAEVDGAIQAIIGWNTEDFIGRVREVYLQLDATGKEAGRQLLEAVCQAAYELMCEVALLFYPPDTSEQEQQVFQGCKFEETTLEELIPAWRKSAKQSMPEDNLILVRKLREKRVMRPV